MFSIRRRSNCLPVCEGGAVRLSGKKPTTVDVSTNLLVESGDEWTQEFSEDATWNVLDRMVGNVGRAVGVKETQKIIAMYEAIAVPKYRRIEKIPFIPTEQEIDQLIAACGEKTSALLQALKETGMRVGEAWNLKWIDIDFVNSTISITPEKGAMRVCLRFRTKC